MTFVAPKVFKEANSCHLLNNKIINKKKEIGKNVLNVLKIKTQFHIIYIVGSGVSNVSMQGRNIIEEVKRWTVF